MTFLESLTDAVLQTAVALPLVGALFLIAGCVVVSVLKMEGE